MKPYHDQAQAQTNKFKLPDDKKNEVDTDEQDKDGNNMQGNNLDAFLDAFDASMLAATWNTPGCGQFDCSFIPCKFDCHGIAAKGALGLGLPLQSLSLSLQVIG